MRNDCEGCRTPILLPMKPCPLSEIGCCPCKSCLVKIMCDRMCPDFEAHIEIFNN